MQEPLDKNRLGKGRPGPWNTNSKSPIDSEILDLILDHFNILSLGGITKEKQVLTSEDFDDIVKIAEKMYYEKIVNNSNVEGKA